LGVHWYTISKHPAMKKFCKCTLVSKFFFSAYSLYTLASDGIVTDATAQQGHLR